MEKIKDRLFIVCVVLLLGVTSVHADSYFAVRVFGDPMGSGNARNAAMGGTGVADFNPEGARRTFSLTGANNWTSQMWTESSNQTRLADSNRVQLQNASMSFPFKSGSWEWKVFVESTMDFNARSSYRIYNSTGLPAGENRFAGSGNILKLGSGVSIPMGSKLSFKLAIYELTGGEMLRFGKYPLNSLPSQDLKEVARYQGFSGEAGLRWRPSKVLNIGAVYQPAVTLKRRSQLTNVWTNQGTNTDGQWQLPPQGILGFNYHPGDERIVELAVDVKHTFWRQAAIDGRVPMGAAALKPIFREVISSTGAPPTAISSLRLRDVTELGVGVSQQLGEKWSLQYGFRYQPFYADRRAETTALALGAGYRANDRWTWFLAGELARRDFIGDGLFYPAGWRVEETLRKIWLTMERRL